MIGKTVVGKGFGGAARYLTEKEKSEILEQNNCFAQDPNALAKQYRNVWAENRDISKPVWHTSISFSEEDKLDVDQMKDLAKEFLQKAGFTPENHQWTIVLHRDTKTPHLHVLANRVGLDGKAVSDFYSKSNTVKWCKEIEKERGLVQVQEVAKSKRMNKSKDPKKEAKREIQDAFRKIKGVKNFDELADKMKESGIDTTIHKHKDGKVYGIAFKKNDIAFKGSQVGKEFAVKAISKALGIPLEPVLKITKGIIQEPNKGMGFGF